MADYLNHHGFRRGAPERSRTEGPPCEECGRPMLAGQRKRHGSCSPVLACCPAHVDLVPDVMQHARDHAEAGPPPAPVDLSGSWMEDLDL